MNIYNKAEYICPDFCFISIQAEYVICQSGNAVIDDWNTSTEPPISF